MEILSPAGSFECVKAAVSNGADAVYLGFGGHHARQNAKGFDEESFFDALAYCRARGVKTYVTLNTLQTDRELLACAPWVEKLSRAGADAVLVQDLGALRMVRMTAPDLPVHASTQMSIHNLAGARKAAELGCSRVVLARELPREAIAFLCKHSPVEVEVFAHGALCVSHSGQCYLSAVIGQRSGNRGLCAGPCRLPYGFSEKADEYPLSMKELSLAGHIQELSRIGVAALKIEGRMRRPEYVALATKVYADALREGREPWDADMEKLTAVFSRQGVTDGYYTETLGAHMFGVREDDAAPRKLFAELRTTYENDVELQRVPVKFACLIPAGQPAMLMAEDDLENKVTVRGPVPEPALERALLEAVVNTQLYKTGGTFYRCIEAKTHLDRGLSLPLSAINAMRREALSKLTSQRKIPPERSSGEFKPGLTVLPREAPPVTTVQLFRLDQLSPELLNLPVALFYLPLTELAENPDNTRSLVRAGTPLAAVLPRVITDPEWPEVARMLETVHALGVQEALVGNLGQIELTRGRGLSPRGDFGLNILNSQSLKEYKHLGLLSAALSFEMNLPQIRDLSHCMDTELIVYGRLPLMLLENCLVKNRAGRCACENLTELKDRTGAHFPLVREWQHRGVLLNSRKLYLADRQESYRHLGLWGARLLFTTENARECVQVTRRYLGLDTYEPHVYTRGLYFRGVE